MNFRVLFSPSPPVLIWDVSPTEVRQGGIGNHAENVKRINARLDDSAQVRPVVTKVEHIDELLRCLEVRQPLAVFVEDVVVVHPCPR